MTEKIPLYVIGLSKDDPANELIISKFGGALEKVQQVLPDIIEAKISIKSQNPEGSRTHYDVTATVKTSKNQLVYTESDWDILKICDQLIKKLEREMPKHDDKRQRDSIRKKEI
ncbi:Sigma 54 modulation / protein [Marine Group I thaumarchaeote SCGC AAA799-E16]|uniref:Sigma 54 modulation / protein n=4 Tax=Marine Group I TaxID=905826 RepID=A0A087S977_9ARCH|nr:Sigma 54 modulation / protein [Marine Group I thaumarchaeote SCGC AAA799-N04]KER06526.1 Sigma 54 modulation / protein [Marine Group I thaumarchaeote SCGC AAA799-E16]KFM18458.1 Sigma 54 modulation / protein [Marine Group I thaumarchaeote SCGC RSA3]KFM22281.1 Sigma 54 modulation / protein [Marine Group I thaumarchaeote SCGC AAA799-B03]